MPSVTCDGNLVPVGVIRMAAWSRIKEKYVNKSEANLADAAVAIILAARKQNIDLNLLEIDAKSVVMDSGRMAVSHDDIKNVHAIIRLVMEEEKKR